MQKPVYHEIPDSLRALLEPVLADYGLELVDLELAENPRAVALRIVVDTPEATGRVPVDDCAKVSREIGTVLDAEADFPTEYRLEVASPGLDRVLAREKDFRAACGREVKLETRGALAGRRHFRGALRHFDGATLLLSVDGQELQIPFRDVKRANQVYEFSSADFAGAQSRRSKRRRGARRARSGEPG